MNKLLILLLAIPTLDFVLRLGCHGIIMSSSTLKNRQRAGNMPPTASHTLAKQKVFVLLPSESKTALSSQVDATIFDNLPMWSSYRILIAWNILGLLVSLLTGVHYHLDLLGAGAFFASVLPVLPLCKTNARIAYSTYAVSIWSIKLASFLFYRALQVHHDARLTSTLSTFGGCIMFWFLSGLWGILTSLPHCLGTTNARNSGSFLTNSVGLTIFAFGWLVETLSDIQKWSFKQQHPGAFCNVGVWKWSQHPNYFGNLVLWSGIFLINLPALVEPISYKGSSLGLSPLARKVWSWRRVGIALLSPLFLFLVFYGQATGTIANSLEMANKKFGYGIDESYTEYVDKTPLIFPSLFKNWFT